VEAMTDISRRAFLKSLGILAGGIVLPVKIADTILNLPIKPELPAGHIEINGILLRIHSLEIISDTGIDNVLGIKLHPPTFDLAFETYDEYPNPLNLINNNAPSSIRISPYGHSTVVLSGKGVLVEHAAELPIDGPIRWEYRFLSTNRWKWGVV
jgi:hypothetical protein